MSRFHAPEDSITKQSVRQAYAHEYMVPVEVAWELEQQRNDYKEMWKSWRKENTANLCRITSLQEDLLKAREDCHRLRKERQAVDRAFHELHKTMMGGAQ